MTPQDTTNTFIETATQHGLELTHNFNTELEKILTNCEDPQDIIHTLDTLRIAAERTLDNYEQNE